MKKRVIQERKISMSDFVFYEKSEDALGHVIYYCKCAECGNDVSYGRKISTKALCITCRNRKRNEYLAERKRKNNIRELVKAVHGYYESFDKMPSIKAFDELVESVVGR